MTAQDIGQTITRLREARGWTQVELAERSGVGQSHISAIERGKQVNVRSDTAAKLAKAFNVPIEAIYGEPVPVPEDFADIDDETLLAWLTEQNRELGEIMRAVKDMPEEQKQEILDHIERELRLIRILASGYMEQEGPDV